MKDIEKGAEKDNPENMRQSAVKFRSLGCNGFNRLNLFKGRTRSTGMAVDRIIIHDVT